MRRPSLGLVERAVADAVGQDDVVAADVERLPGPEQLVGELRLEKLASAAAGAVQHHDRVDDASGGIAPGRAERRVVDAQLGQGLAAARSGNRAARRRPR